MKSKNSKFLGNCSQLILEPSSASEIKDRIQGVAQAEYVMYLERYADIQFAIARLVE